MTHAAAVKGAYNFGHVYGLDDIDAALTSEIVTAPAAPKTHATSDRPHGWATQQPAPKAIEEGDEGDSLIAELRGQLAAGKRRAFCLAGKAIVTVRSKATGARFTYKISQSKPAIGCMPVFFVALLNGSDNTSDYQYIGTIFPEGFRTTRKSRLSAAAPSVVAFSWFTKHFEDARVEVWHEGRCGRCGRALTVPESIESGLGPVCAGKAV